MKFLKINVTLFILITFVFGVMGAPVANVLAEELNGVETEEAIEEDETVYEEVINDEESITQEEIVIDEEQDINVPEDSSDVDTTSEEEIALDEENINNEEEIIEEEPIIEEEVIDEEVIEEEQAEEPAPVQRALMAPKKVIVKSDVSHQDEIDTLTSKYNDLKTNLDNVSDINEYLQLLESAYSLNEEYASLVQDLSDTDDTTALDELYNQFSNDSIQQLFLNLVNGADLTDEDVINQLLAFEYLDQDSEAYNKLMEALEDLNKVEVKDNDKFTGEEQGEYLVLEGLGNFTVGDLLDNINYNGTITTTSENDDLVTGDVELVFMDANGHVVKTLKIVLKCDLDNNGVVDDNDLDILKDLVNDSSNVDEHTLLVADTNNDGVLDQQDIDNLYDLLNPSEEEEEDEPEDTTGTDEYVVPVDIVNIYTSDETETPVQVSMLSNDYAEEPEVDTTVVKDKAPVEKKDVDKDKKEEPEKKKITVGTIIKIAIIILLGALIIYLLNKDSKDDEEKEKK